MHQLRTDRTTNTTVASILLLLIVAMFAARNLPWHLDDYDQAKQAFVSFEMVETGEWWFQHTPAGKIATKPPLAGWISAGLYFAFGKNGWEFAWRLPSFASALILLALMWRCGRELAGVHGALLAACAFGCNVLATRLATLVRTDMMLTLFIFLSGWLIFEHVRRAERWSTRDRVWLGLTVLGSILTKGPILFAFLMPGLAAFALLARRRGVANHAWPGWSPWLVPLLAFGAWVGIGVWLSRDFHQQVVLREFLGRFDLSDAPIHKHQPLYFYLPHLLGKWAPWAAALPALLCLRSVRARLRMEPALLWLLCWGVGGLVLMSLVPSKRVDRIFPIIPPLCLLLAALAHGWSECALRQRRWCDAAFAIGALVSVIYAAIFVRIGFRDDKRALVRFGQQVRAISAASGKRFELVDPRDEGMLLYAGKVHDLKPREAIAGWQAGKLDRVVILADALEENRATFEPFRPLLELPRPTNKHGAYIFIERAERPANTPPQP